MEKGLSSLFEQPQNFYPIVWDKKKISIYQHLLPWQDELNPLPSSLIKLPDTPEYNNNELRWAAGAEDGVLGHHQSWESETEIPALVNLLTKAARTGNAATVAQFCQVVIQDLPFLYVDNLIKFISQTQNINIAELQPFIEWLIRCSPDRNIVKVAIRLMTFFPTDENIHLLYCLAAHDEFTLYVIITLHSMISSPSAYNQIWLNMAKRVKGWGRIHLIEHLPDEISEEIQTWLLNTGYSNSVMNEYTAWHCATSCHLADVLERPVDTRLLTSATEILEALFYGGPAQDISDYQDAPRCCLNYLKQIFEHTYSLEYYFTITSIYRYFIKQKIKSEESTQIIALAKSILKQRIWNTLIAQGLKSENKKSVNQATAIGKIRNYDISKASANS